MMKNKRKMSEEEKKIEQEADTYQKNGFLSKVPFCIKAIILKYWFFGAICFFVFIGTGMFVGSNFDLLLIGGLVSGAIFDIACHNVLNIIDKDDQAKYYMFFRKEKCWYSIFINVAYHIILFLAFGYTISAFKAITGTEENWFLREPFSQALLLSIYDALFMLIKNFVVDFIKRAMSKKE